MSAKFDVVASAQQMVALANMMNPCSLEKKFTNYTKEFELLEKHLKSFNGNCIVRLQLRWQAFIHGTTLEEDRKISEILLSHFQKQRDRIAAELGNLQLLKGTIHVYHDLVQKHEVSK